MDSLQQHLQKLLEQNRKALHELVEVTDVASADFVHVSDAMNQLNEQMHLIMQMQYEAREAAAGRTLDTSSDVKGADSKGSDTPASDVPNSNALDSVSGIKASASKRSRGGQKRYYILEQQDRADFCTHTSKLFKQCYGKSNKFELPDHTLVNPPKFLALLYFLGIKLGLTTGDAPVNDFYYLVTEAVACLEDIDFYTAYPTVQRETRICRSYISDTTCYDTSIHLHTIDPTKVLPRHRNAYTRDIALLSQLEALWHI